jgi:hypothetical protein
MGKTDSSSLIRRIVAVEGIHDRHVFSSLLRDSLGGGQILLPMHGASRARSLVDQNLLLTVTDSPVLVVLDNVRNEEVQRCKEAIIHAVESGDIEEAESHADNIKRSSRDEEGAYLASLFRLAIHEGLVDHIDVHGLEMPDVICYLPEDVVLSSPGRNWIELVAEWRDLLDRQIKGVPGNFKKWLKKEALLPQLDSDINALVEDGCAAAVQDNSPLRFDLPKLADRFRAWTADDGSRL